MLNGKILRAARALLDWDQSDLARAARVSLGTIRKVEQGATGVRRSTAKRIIEALDKAGVALLKDGPDGGKGVRLKEREMTESMRAYFELQSKIKGWFIYNKGYVDGEDLDGLVAELAFDAYTDSLDENQKLEIPDTLVQDLKKLEDLESEIGAEQDEEMFSVARARGWDGKPNTLQFFLDDDDDFEG